MRLLILYGSQTGNAKLEATRLAQLLLGHGLVFKISDCDSYDFSNILEEQYIVFMVSTTGQGDFPFNMQAFWDKLLIDFPKDMLSHLNVSVFGFGDSTYQKYNRVAKLLQKRLLQLGAKEFVGIAYGDDSEEDGYLQSLYTWRSQVIKTFVTDFKGNGKIDYSCESMLTYQLHNDSTPPFSHRLGQKQLKVLNSTLISSKDHFQDIYQLTLETPLEFEYKPGDIVSIYYINTDESVEELMQYIDTKDSGVVLSVVDRFKSLSSFPFCNRKLSLRDLFKYVLDICRPPSIYFLKNLTKYIKHDIYKEKIDEMTYDDYYDYIVKEKRKLWEVLFDFKIEKVSLDDIFTHFTQIGPREYSIASSKRLNEKELRVVYNVVRYKTDNKRTVNGLCTSYLSQIKPGELIGLDYHKNIYEYTVNKLPKLIIATGTGIAPFLSLLEELEINGMLDSDKHIVVFGCRYKDKDYIYRGFLERLEKENKIRLFPAFSRDTKEKKYVQHIIQEDKRKVFVDYLSKHIETLKIHVCGNSKFLPKSIDK